MFHRFAFAFIFTIGVYFSATLLAQAQEKGRSTLKKENAQKKTKKKIEDYTAQKTADTVASLLFPDWPPQDFDWHLGPIVGMSYAENRSEAGKIRSTTFEGGLASGLSGIPIVPGNPGFSLAPSAEVAFGNVCGLFDVLI